MLTDSEKFEVLRAFSGTFSKSDDKRFNEGLKWFRNELINVVATASDSFLDLVELAKADKSFSDDFDQINVVIPPYGFGFTKERLIEAVKQRDLNLIYPDSNVQIFVHNYLFDQYNFFEPGRVKTFVDWYYFYLLGRQKHISLFETFGEFLRKEKSKLNSLYESGVFDDTNDTETRRLAAILGSKSVFSYAKIPSNAKRIIEDFTVGDFISLMKNDGIFPHLQKELSVKGTFEWILRILRTKAADIFAQRKEAFDLFRQSLETYGCGNLPESEFYSDFFFLFDHIVNDGKIRFDLVVDEIKKLNETISPIDFISLMMSIYETDVLVSRGNKQAVALLLVKGISQQGYNFIKIVTEMALNDHKYHISIANWRKMINSGLFDYDTCGVEVGLAVAGFSESSLKTVSQDIFAFRQKYAYVYDDEKFAKIANKSVRPS